MKPEQLAAAKQHLLNSDGVMQAIVSRVGDCTLKPKRDRFATLTKSIVSQQVSTKAAQAIFGRLRERMRATGVTADGLAQLSIDELRAIGVSRQKASYLHDLAEKTRDGIVRFERFGRLDNETIIDELVQIKGIGRWTAQMLLIFSLGRLDVLPVDDFGIRSAIKNQYRLSDLPKRGEIEALAEPWRPFASIASWYLWRSLDG